MVHSARIFSMEFASRIKSDKKPVKKKKKCKDKLDQALQDNSEAAEKLNKAIQKTKDELLNGNEFYSDT